MFKKIKKETLIFIIIFIAASLIRLLAINKVPPSLNWDEVSHGYNAYSILKTGKDEWGVGFPTIFRAYGDYKLPLYIYATSLSESIFGLSAFSVRLPSILAGISMVLFMYLLAKRLFGEKTALFTALLFAFEPWTFFVSRGAFEANLALCFVVTGIYFFVKGLEKPKNLPISALFLGLSVWTYNSERVFVPPLILAILFIYKEELQKIWKKNKQSIFRGGIIFLLFFIPMLVQLIKPAGQARYGWVAILDEGAIAKINEARTTSTLPKELNIAFNNKAVFFVKEFIGNYTSHFSVEFLYKTGGTHYQFNLPNFGLLYLVGLPFFVAGLIFLLKKKDKTSKLLLAWLFLSPIPSSLTREAPHALRALIIAPAMILITAIGVIKLAEYLKKKNIPVWAVIIFYLFFFFVSSEDYYSKYFNDFAKDYSWSWQYGYKEVVNYAKDNYDSYDKIIITKKYGESHEFVLFYWPWDPELYRNDNNLIRFHQSNWYWVDGFDKFYFVNDWQIPESGSDFILESGKEFSCQKERCLLVVKGGGIPEGWRLLETINFLDGSSAFQIVTNK